MPTLLPDQVIGGKYRIVKLLGAGGMGAVYEVHQMDIGRIAAVGADVLRYPSHCPGAVVEKLRVTDLWIQTTAPGQWLG